MGSFIQRADRAKVLIVDSAELFRRGIQDVLAGDERFAVGGDVSRLEDVEMAYASARPDIVVAGSDDAAWAMTALRSVMQVDREARVIVLTPPEAGDQVQSFVREGARGVVQRGASTRTILTALHEVCDGGSVLDAHAARMLFASLAAAPEPSRAPAPEIEPAVLSLLSQREGEVLQALTRGYRNKQIGAELGVSVGTVKTHLRHIFRKLRVADRTGAVLKALDGGMLKAA